VSPARGPGRPSEEPVSVQTRFERFPVSIRGAFVMRGADGDPHAIHVEWARLARLPSGATRPVVLEDRMLTVSPVRDLFVPFEVGILDLEPGWYEIRSALRVDAGKTWEFAGRAFSVPWARADIRRGSIQVGKGLEVGGLTFEVDRIELGPDRAVVHWGGEPEGALALLIADGSELEVLPPHAVTRLLEPRDPEGNRTVSYPVPKSCRSLEVLIHLPGGERSAPIPLPTR
jgi:hypothetical protein